MEQEVCSGQVSCPKLTKSKDVELGLKLRPVCESWDDMLSIFAFLAPRIVPNAWEMLHKYCRTAWELALILHPTELERTKVSFSLAPVLVIWLVVLRSSLHTSLFCSGLCTRG